MKNQDYRVPLPLVLVLMTKVRRAGAKNTACPFGNSKKHSYEYLYLSDR
jgi:hypothetical protein